jgi:hypothetical protein
MIKTFDHLVHHIWAKKYAFPKWNKKNAGASVYCLIMSSQQFFSYISSYSVMLMLNREAVNTNYIVWFDTTDAQTTGRGAH